MLAESLVLETSLAEGTATYSFSSTTATLQIKIVLRGETGGDTVAKQTNLLNRGIKIFGKIGHACGKVVFPAPVKATKNKSATVISESNENTYGQCFRI